MLNLSLCNNLVKHNNMYRFKCYCDIYRNSNATVTYTVNGGSNQTIVLDSQGVAT